MSEYELYIKRFDELVLELMRAKGYASTDEITEADIAEIRSQTED